MASKGYSGPSLAGVLQGDAAFSFLSFCFVLFSFFSNILQCSKNIKKKNAKRIPTLPHYAHISFGQILPFQLDVLLSYLPPASASFRPVVLLGHVLSLFHQELMKDFLEKRAKGQLLIQRNRRLKENLLRPVILFYFIKKFLKI